MKIFEEFIVKKVIVRAEGAGILFGTLKSLEGDTCILQNARKLWYWSGACAIEQIATEGVKTPLDCKFTTCVSEIGIFNILQILPCTDKAAQNIESVPEWKK